MSLVNITLLFVFMVAAQALAASACPVLSDFKSPNSITFSPHFPTEELIRYLGRLVEGRLISEVHLRRILEQQVDQLENPITAIEGPTTVEWVVNGKPIRLQPNNPVDNITWWSGIVFTNEYSKKHNLPEAYDLNGLSFRDLTNPQEILNSYDEIRATAAKGFLFVPELEMHPRYNNPTNQPRDTSGFRMLTTFEFARVTTGGLQQSRWFCLGGDAQQAHRYGWFKENSGEVTHPVASLLPCTVYGNEFFDLIGNVSQMMFDLYTEGASAPYELKLELTEGFMGVIGADASKRFNRTDMSITEREMHKVSGAVSRAQPAPFMGFRIGRSIPPPQSSAP